MTNSLTRREAMATIATTAGGVMLPTVVSTPSAIAADKTNLIRYGKSRSFDVVHQMWLTNRDSRLQSLEIWLPIPLDVAEQTVSNLKIEPQVPVWTDEQGQSRVARLLIDEGLPKIGETRSLKLSYRVTRKAVSADRKALDHLPYQEYKQDDNFAAYTRAEKRIDSRSAKITEIAGKLKGNRRSAVAIARAAYDWVIDHTKYKLLDEVTSAAYCLEHGEGECTEYAALFVALCRAAGVPARAVTGFRANETDGWHAWAEFMLPSEEWIPVDPTQGDHGDFSRRVSFGATDNRRVALCKTYDIQLKDVNSGQSETDFLQAGRWWWTWRSKQKKPKPAKRPDYKYQVIGKPAA